MSKMNEMRGVKILCQMKWGVKWSQMKWQKRRVKWNDKQKNESNEMRGAKMDQMKWSVKMSQVKREEWRWLKWNDTCGNELYEIRIQTEIKKCKQETNLFTKKPCWSSDILYPVSFVLYFYFSPLFFFVFFCIFLFLLFCLLFFLTFFLQIPRSISRQIL